MAEQRETSSTLVTVATEVFKTAYTDAFQPGAKEFGKTGETLGRAVNAALAPVRGAVWGIELIESFVKSKVQEKLEQKKVDPEDVQIPDPDIAVPSIEALRYSKLKEEFANLLASSMDKRSSADAHPSFVEILKQITPDEAKIINVFQSPLVGIPFISFRLTQPNGGFNDLPSFISKIGENSGIERPENILGYMDNLQRLRLVHIPIGQRKNDPDTYKELETFTSEFDQFANMEGYVLERLKGVVHLTEYGAKFKRTCLT